MTDIIYTDRQTMLTGQIWREKNGGSTWKIVAMSLDPDMISVTGPGPCRGYRSIDLDTFLDRWEPVDRPS